MAVDFSLPLQACLIAFGQACIFTRVGSESSQQLITGILDEGVEQEAAAPGDGSTYAILILLASSINPAPVKGDEISTTTSVYKIVGIDRDSGDGMQLTLRYDRERS